MAVLAYCDVGERGEVYVRVCGRGKWRGGKSFQGGGRDGCGAKVWGLEAHLATTFPPTFTGGGAIVVHAFDCLSKKVT